MRILAAILSCVLTFGGAAASAQSFDNFDGDSTLDGFELGTDGESDQSVPSLGAEDGLSIGPDIELSEDGDSGDAALFTIPGSGRPVTSVSQPETASAMRATLRALDKTLGRPTDIDLAQGETVLFGRVAIRLVDCRYPADNPSSDAFAHLEVYDLEGNPLFDGWMVASSPALNALEHPRYDVWVLRCAVPDTE